MRGKNVTIVLGVFWLTINYIEAINYTSNQLINYNIKKITIDKPKINNILDIKIDKQLEIGDSNSDNFAFYGKLFLTIDEKENLIISNNRTVKKYDKYGNYMFKIGEIGQGPGEYANPSNIFIDVNNNIYVKDFYKLLCYSENGEYIKNINLNNIGNEAAILSDSILMKRNYMREKDEIDDVITLNLKNGNSKNIAEYKKTKRYIKGRQVRLFGETYDNFICISRTNIGEGIVGLADKYEIIFLDGEGDPTNIIEKKEKPIRIEKSERNDFINKNFEIFKKGPFKSTRNEVADLLALPKNKPYFKKIYYDNNKLFIEKYESKEGKSKIYDVISLDGEYLFILRLNITPVIIKNQNIYTIEKDVSSDYEIIVKYKMIF